MEAGGQYMFNRKWGVMLEVPYWSRYYKGAMTATTPTFIRYQDSTPSAISGSRECTPGLSEDMSTGLLAGAKVPSG